MSRLEEGVLVTGANGWIGRSVCAYLKSAGCFVVACDLEESPGEWDAFIPLNLLDDPVMEAPAFERVCDRAEKWSLIHCAGYAHRPNETPEEVERFYAINAEGTKRVIDWCGRVGVNRLLYISSIAFYDWEGQPESGRFDEAAPTVARTAYADSKLKGERAVVESGMDFRVVRLATVFGVNDRANFAKLAAALKARRFILPGRGEARKSVVSVDRAAEWISRFATMDDPKHRVLNLGFSEAPDLRTICDAFSEECGFAPARRVPVGLLKSLATAGDLLAKAKPNFPLTSVNVGKLTRSTAVDCSRAEEVFPDLKRVQFSNELRAASDYYRSL